MQLVKMKCNNCNAPLDVDLDNLQAFCPYCGQKLMMDFDQLAWVLSEKEKTKRVVEREEHQTIREKMAYEHESKENDKDWKRTAIWLGSSFLVLIIVYLIIAFPHFQKVKQLQHLEAEIEVAINAEDYDLALLKVNQLYCDDGYSDEEKASWDAKRKAFIKIIEEKKRELDLLDPNNIFMPVSSKELKGKNYRDVVDQFTELGFENITTMIASKEAGLFDKNETVEHILIGGKTEFTSEDYFNKDTMIVVYYYSKK